MIQKQLVYSCSKARFVDSLALFDSAYRCQWENENTAQLSPKSEGYYNSFKPMMTLHLAETDGVLTVDIQCRLWLGVRIFVAVYCLIALLFEAALLLTCPLDNYLFLLLPLGLIAFALGITYAGFHLSIYRFVKELTAVIQSEDN